VLKTRIPNEAIDDTAVETSLPFELNGDESPCLRAWTQSPLEQKEAGFIPLSRIFYLGLFVVF
jgi:hypothetical protein